MRAVSPHLLVSGSAFSQNRDVLPRLAHIGGRKHLPRSSLARSPRECRLYFLTMCHTSLAYVSERWMSPGHSPMIAGSLSVELMRHRSRIESWPMTSRSTCSFSALTINARHRPRTDPAIVRRPKSTNQPVQTSLNATGRSSQERLAYMSIAFLVSYSEAPAHFTLSTQWHTPGR